MTETLPRFIRWFLPLLLVPTGLPAQGPGGKLPDKLFHVPRVEYTGAQEVEVAKIREKYTPQILAHREKRAEAQSPEQQKAWMTEQQKILRAMRGELLALLTPEQRALRQGKQARAPQHTRGRKPTHANVSYGPHARNLMDVWIAESEAPTPVFISIHGGGFRAGNKSVDPRILAACLERRISVVALTYRFSQDAIAPACFYDCARAIQFIRHNATAWNLDKTRLASSGGSAGAGLSLWLGFHEDLADPDNNDPVLRESTRLSAISVYNGQTSYDPRVIRDLFPGTDTYKHSALAQLFDVDLNQLDDLPAEKYALFEQVSALPHLSKDDPPVVLTYASAEDAKVTNQGIGIHHPKFGFTLKAQMDKLGITCTVITRNSRSSDARIAATMQLLTTTFGLKD